MVQTSAKYILRGTSHVDEGGVNEGGEFTPDPKAAKWPAGFLERATALWKKTDADFGDNFLH
jgi:hypothetical protein